MYVISISILTSHLNWFLWNFVPEKYKILDFWNNFYKDESRDFLDSRPKEWHSNINISHGRASKIIWNDTNLEPFSWDRIIKNSLWNFCVGVL